MLYGAQVAVYSEINTKHTHTHTHTHTYIYIYIVWAECQFLSFKPVGARNQ